MNNPNFPPNMMAAAANRGTNVQQFMLRHYQQQQQQNTQSGWQQTVAPEERARNAIQLFTSFRLLKSDQSEQHVLQGTIQVEGSIFMSSASKEQYMNTIRQKLQQMQALRQQHMAPMQGNMAKPMNQMNPAQVNPAAQMGGMMMGGQNGQQMRPNGPGAMPQGFANSQLQRPMQVSPIPMAQTGSSMGMNAGNNGTPAQAQMKPPQQNMPQGQQQQAQANAFINKLATKLMESAREDVKQQYQQEVNQWPEERKQQLLSRGVIPIFYRFRMQAEHMIKSGKLGAMPMGAAVPGQTQPGQTGQGMQQQQQPGQMQNQMQNQANVMNQTRPSNQTFDFDALTNQQEGALQVQGQGQEVVPASNNPMGAQMGFPGQDPQAAQQQQQNNTLAQRQTQAQAQTAAFQNMNSSQGMTQIQRQAQAQAARAQMQQAQAQQQQQRNSTQMLHGQVGGLNLPPGAQQSPAMPMLNRPMAPPGQPGQPGPSTPQQRPQPQMPQMMPQGGISDPHLTQLMLEAQQRAKAVGIQGPPLNEQTRLRLMGDMDPAIKNQLLKIPDQNFRQILNRGPGPMQNNIFPGGQPGQPNMQMMNQTQGLQMGNMPANMMNGSAMSSMRPGGMNMNQQTPAAMGQRPAMLPPAQRLAAAQALLQANPGIIQRTDNQPYPPGVLNESVRQSVPAHVKTWAQLKQWAQSNPAIMPGVDSQKLLLLQVLNFHEHFRSQHTLAQQQQMQQQQAQAQQQTQQAQVQTQQQQRNGLFAGRQPNGIAPPAQMTPGSVPARPQALPNMANMGNLTVTPQEIQAVRMKYPPQFAGATDEQLRTLVLSQKMNLRKQQFHQQQQHAMNAQAQQRGQAQAQQPPMNMAGQMPPQPSRPPTAQGPPQPTPQTKPAAPPQQTPQAAQSNSATVLNKNHKRPNDDGADAPADGSSTNIAPQAPAMVASRSQQAMNLSQEQLSKMTPQMRANLMKAQDASNNKSQQLRGPSMEEITAKMKDPAQDIRFKTMLMEEEQKLPRGQAVQLAPEKRNAMQQLVKEQFNSFRKVVQALRVFLVSSHAPEAENIVRKVMRARCLVLRQINPADGSLRPDITISENDFREQMKIAISFVQKVMSQFSAQQGSQMQQNRDAGPPQKLSTTNLTKLEEQQQKQRQQEQKVPPPPTTTHPPFKIGGPIGVPTYPPGAKTISNLTLPVKKQKLNPTNQSSTPRTKDSPRVEGGKVPSPELKMHQPPAVQKPTFNCKDADCEYATRGFDSQAELDAHVGHAHAKIDDPYKYALDTVADFLDVDSKTGQPKQETGQRATKAAPASRAPPPQAAKTGQTPSMPPSAATPAAQQTAATPMAHVPTQPGVKSSPSTNLLKTPQTGAKVATPSTGAPAKATPASTTKAAPKEAELPAPLEPEMEDVQPLIPTSLLEFSYDEVYASLDAKGPFTALDLKDEDNSWALRSRPSSPLNTPDSTPKDTPSTRQSDISENDNLQINIDMKDTDLPDGWLNAMAGDALPLDVQLSEDLQSLGVALPPMDNSDMMLFYGDSGMMDLDALDQAMYGMGETTDLGTT